MSGAIMNKIWGALGNREIHDEKIIATLKPVIRIATPEDDKIQENNKENKLWGRRNNKVVAMPQPQQVKMVISQPTTFDQAEDICDLLKEKQSVIVNLEYVNKDVARRIIDVVSGAVHALDGHMQKVSNAIFLIAPFNYDIENEMVREEMRSKISVSWLRNGNNTVK